MNQNIKALLAYYAMAANWYGSASDQQLIENNDTREAAFERMTAIEAELLAAGFEFPSEPVAVKAVGVAVSADTVRLTL